MRPSWLAAAAAFALLPANAIAQEAPSQGAPSDWSGFYVGGGGSWITVDSVIGEDMIGPPATANSRSDISSEGWSLSLFGGYNWQLASNFVVGGEADVTSINASTSDAPMFNVNPPTTIPSPGSVFGGDLKWMGTLRLRAGYALGPWMPYLTAGWAFAGYETASDYSGLAPYTRDDTWNAPVYGVGVDYLAHGNWSVRGEYRWADFDTQSDAFPTFPAFAEFRDLSVEELRFSVAYNF